ncbi:DoxX family protein [Novosphingobium album (ex Liu et al. 2023)]|uniref:DoxX family protein n=1 Tax=Novosphingobium album (ex Liu et al. 2023) TaxID=3031130 RepID=A0ABT5WR91_9SPHN|nr:DoxX family protein [Novosphingobium album (ex Liu et al. 2023)]MDE8652364.1 DoxX family protein [Novosphingobium album (ex Liu et al. 2023)]
MSKIAAIIGRLLLALIFIVSGAGKLLDVSATETMIVGAGLPGGLAIPVGLFELLAGLCLALGFMVRLVAILLTVFVALTILFFHNRFTDPVQGVMALKNLAIIGGLFLAFAHSQMWSHYYAIRSERRGELFARRAEDRVHEAELRAARAEAEAKAVREGQGVAGTTYADSDGDGIAARRVRGRWFDW